MLSIISKTALQCPFENILLLRQIQRQSSPFKSDVQSLPFKEEGESNKTVGDANEMIGTLDLDGYLKADHQYAKQLSLDAKYCAE